MIRNAEGSVALARLDNGHVLMARWCKRQLAHEIVVEWSLELEGHPIALYEKKSGAPTVMALHRWDEGHETPRPAVLKDDGTWEIVVPIAWHTMCAAFSGTMTLELDAARKRALYSDDIHVEL